MVSYSKSSAALFFASAVGVASGHKIPKNLDKEAFAAKLWQLRKDQAELIKQNGNGRGNGGGNGANNGNSSGNGSIIPGSTTDASAFLDGHEFIGPSGSDSRGPCPFINVMANHGFINRSGRNVAAFLIPELATILFDLPSAGFFPIVNLSIFDGQTVTSANGEQLLDIERLWDRPGEERDVSMIFPNPGLMLTPENLNRPASEGFEQDNDEIFVDFRYAISEAQLTDLLSRAENGVLTQAHHNAFLHDRLIDSLEHDEFARYSHEDEATSTGQYVLPTLILGEDVSDFSFVPASHIEGLWREFRFPDGYAPRSVRFGAAFDPEFYQAERVRFDAINDVTVEEILSESANKRLAEAKEAVKKVEAAAAAYKASKSLRGKDAKVAIA